ncbi:MAG: 50S ribosomal protein L33 [Patescibacteria group bacterium]|jgi:large subunit ribosomal protein L33
MAKKEARKTAVMICSVCGLSNVHSERNSTNTPEKLQLQKYCKVCRKRTLHKEKK